MEKQVYALVKALKFFSIYVFHSEVLSYFPNISVKEILVQPDSEGKRRRWIAKIMEYDVDIKPTKLVKGQGLAKLLAESNCQVLDLHLVAEQLVQDSSTKYDKEHIFNRYLDSPWYEKIVYFLLHLQCPPYLNKSEYR